MRYLVSMIQTEVELWIIENSAEDFLVKMQVEVPLRNQVAATQKTLLKDSEQNLPQEELEESLDLENNSELWMTTITDL